MQAPAESSLAQAPVQSDALFSARGDEVQSWLVPWDVNSGAQASLGAMTVTRVDDAKVRIQSERSTPVMDAVLAEWPFVVFLVKGGERLFTGPFAVETFADGDRIELVPNPHYPQALGRPLVTVRKYASGQALAAALAAGQVDLAFHLPVGELTDLRAQQGITVKSFEVERIARPSIAATEIRKLGKCL